MWTRRRDPIVLQVIQTSFASSAIHTFILNEKKKERMTQEADVKCSPCDWLNVSEWMLWDAASGIHAAGVIHRWCSWLIYRLRYPFFACPHNLFLAVVSYFTAVRRRQRTTTHGTTTTTTDDAWHDDDDHGDRLKEGRKEGPNDRVTKRESDWGSERVRDGWTEWRSDGVTHWVSDLMIWWSSILLNYKREGDCKQSNYRIHAVATDFNCIASMHSVTTEFNCISIE